MKSGNKKNKYGNNLNNRGAISFNKSKSKNKHRNIALSSTASKSDGNKSKRPTTSFDYPVKKESDSKSGQSSINKYDARNLHIKEEPISDTEVRNESESDTDSDTDKKKSNKKYHDKSSSKKANKSQKSRKSGKGEDGSHYDNNANSDENSNDSGNNLAKSELYKKTNIKTETGGENAMQRDDGDGHATNNTNLDKSSSSVEEFDNEKPTKVVKVNINLDYDSEVYNEEINVRKFHKYQRNIEMANQLQVTPFDSVTESLPFESAATAMLESGQQMNYSSSESDSDDSDANDLDDSDNSSCDECATGPCNTSILPPLINGSTASSPDMSMSSYYNKNGNISTINVLLYIKIFPYDRNS